MALPPRGDPRRPLHLAVRSMWVLGVMLVLLGLCGSGASLYQSDFYSYRYFASEGFLPGYNFPRLPLSAFIPGRRGSADEVPEPEKGSTASAARAITNTRGIVRNERSADPNRPRSAQRQAPVTG